MEGRRGLRAELFLSLRVVVAGESGVAATALPPHSKMVRRERRTYMGWREGSGFQNIKITKRSQLGNAENA
jgi:hypothetical protein